MQTNIEGKKVVESEKLCVNLDPNDAWGKKEIDKSEKENEKHLELEKEAMMTIKEQSEELERHNKSEEEKQGWKNRI